ncbi:hypothetical protein VM98_16495 [Streptomyces rubellomurinus subsp. indigoferus]|nr:hypothetical protein VM98_16495 [Streptomyces rubellomurinus subsp. indigoferus]
MTTEPAEPSPAPAPAVPPAPAAPAAPPQPSPAPAAITDLSAEPHTAPHAGPAPAPAAPGDVLAAGPEQPARAPRRPRPVLLSVYGLVLGVLAGGGVGYAVQAQRPPTPLPPLQVALPGYPAAPVDASAFAAAQPKAPAIEGDLTKLLVKPPAGSEPWGDFPDKASWVSVGELAEHKGDAADLFKSLLGSGIRRAAEVDWKKDGIRYRVTLTQYTAQDADNAKPDRGQQFADDVDSSFRIYDTPRHWADSTDTYYYGSAAAKRGSVQMLVEVFAPQPLDAEAVKSLAKEQWERLV